MDVESAEFKKALLELRSRALSQTPDLQDQLTSAMDPQYWRDLNSNLTVCGNEPGENMESEVSDPEKVNRSLETLSAHGYFQIPSIAARPVVDRMRRSLEVTHTAGWHPVFVFVYDDFWRAFRGQVLVRFLTGALGRGYRQLPYIWGHYVAPNSSGWRPHVDGPCDLNKITVWLALNDATLENGCMYVVPRTDETNKISDEFLSVESIAWKDAKSVLQNVKAVPATAGSYLGWGPYVIHWGSTSDPQASPRISISVEFASQPSDPLADKLRLMDPSATAPLPSFRKRLRLIAKAIRNYEAFDSHVLKYLPLANQIISQTTEKT